MGEGYPSSTNSPPQGAQRAGWELLCERLHLLDVEAGELRYLGGRVAAIEELTSNGDLPRLHALLSAFLHALLSAFLSALPSALFDEFLL